MSTKTEVEKIEDLEYKIQRLEEDLKNKETEIGYLERVINDGPDGEVLTHDTLDREIAAKRLLGLFNQLSNEHVEAIVVQAELKWGLDSLPGMYRNLDMSINMEAVERVGSC